jgi:oxygen-dependent protoporphyrinogen oxidase
MPDVVVVGAGVSGLACARRLHQGGLDVLVIESDTRPGGVVQSHTEDGYLVESGPNSILPTEASVAQIADAGLADELVTAPPNSPRYIYVGGKIRRAPWVLSPLGIGRALLEPFIPRGPEEPETVESFFTRRFGREVHDRLAAPFIGGVYAGDTSKLSLEAAFPRLEELERQYGSVVMGMIRGKRSGPRYGLSSFRRGMGTLPEGLAAGLDIRCGTPVSKLSSGWQVHFGDEGAEAPVVVLAVPSYIGSELLRSISPGMAELLGSVWYAPIVVAAMSVPDTEFQVPLTGFGFLVPRTEGVQVLGTLFNSSLFPGRSPDGQALLTSFIGGALLREVVAWSDDRIWDVVSQEVETVLSLGAGTVKPVRLFRQRRAIPQYPLGHSEWLSWVKTKINELPGLFLTGNYLEGVSVPASMEHGHRTAGAVIEYIGGRK